MSEWGEVVRLGDPNAGKKPRSLREVALTESEPECPGVHTLIFHDDVPVTAGQFYMVWLPGKGEIPLSASVVSPGDRRGFTVAAVGPKTHALNTLKPGETIGVRGPFGRGFVLEDDWLLVGGGVGASPIIAALASMMEKGFRATVVLGATRGDALILQHRARDLLIGEDTGGFAGGTGINGESVSTRNGSLHICTDDGSEGYHGLASQLAHSLIMDRKDKGVELFKGVASCGPEPMLLTLLELAGLHGIRCQFSLERYMRCGVGICDSCSMDGHQICRDGPVFPGETLKEMSEFGRFVRDLSGRKKEMWRHGRKYQPDIE